MQQLSQTKSSTNSVSKDIDAAIKALHPECRAKVRCVLGIEIENELIAEGRLAKLMNGAFVVTEHTSKVNPRSHYDGKCLYNGRPYLFEVKGTFDRFGAHARKGTSELDTLMMNNAQNSALRQEIQNGNPVLLILHFFHKNFILVVDMSLTYVEDSTSYDDDAYNEKTLYNFEEYAVLTRIENAVTCRAKIRTRQWEYITRHQKHCSSDKCTVEKHKI